MAGLKHLGFILTLATWLQEGCHAALGLYATGRQYLPEAADKVVQSAEDASVTVFNLFLAPIVPKAHDAATSWLEWIDDKLDQRLVVVVDFYETTKSDIAAFVAQLKDTHGERLESFVAAREGVSCWFKGLARVLKEEGVRNGSVYVVGTLQEYVELAVSTMKDGAVKVSELGPVSAFITYCKELWSKAADGTGSIPLFVKLQELFTSQLLPFLLACITYLRNLQGAVSTTAAKVGNAFSDSWSFGLEKANALLDMTVASPKYAQAVDYLGSAITWAQSTTAVKKVSSAVAPYAMPAIELVEGNQLFQDIVERIKPIKRD